METTKQNLCNTVGNFISINAYIKEKLSQLDHINSHPKGTRKRITKHKINRKKTKIRRSEQK